MKERIKETLASLGFVIEQLEGDNYAFTFEDCRIVMVPNQEDEHFLFLTIPCIVNNEELSCQEIADIMNIANYELRFTKAYCPNGEDVWLSYEYEVLDEKEDLEMILTHMIQHLALGKKYLGKLIYATYQRKHPEGLPEEKS